MKGRLLSAMAMAVTLGLVSIMVAPVLMVSSADPDPALEPTVFGTSPGDPLPGLSDSEKAKFEAGRTTFLEVDDVANGLGPAFNSTSCANCHVVPAVGGGDFSTEFRAGRQSVNHKFEAVDFSRSRTLFRVFSIPIYDHLCQERIPEAANVMGRRQAIPLFGDGLVEAIPDEAIKGEQKRQSTDPTARALGISGRIASVLDVVSQTQRVGRFGWKAQIATLLHFSGDAYLNEQGITNPLFPQEVGSIDPSLIRQCDQVPDPEDAPDQNGVADIDRFTDFMTFLAPAPRENPQDPQVVQGEQLFGTLGCSICHRPNYTTGASEELPKALRSKAVPLYSDLLLHDVGTGDGIPQAAATGEEFRTPPLWGLHLRKPFLHGGGATTYEEALLQHGGEAARVRESFTSLNPPKKDALLAFLGSL